jgi:hypothetical protein
MRFCTRSNPSSAFSEEGSSWSSDWYFARASLHFSSMFQNRRQAIMIPVMQRAVHGPEPQRLAHVALGRLQHIRVEFRRGEIEIRSGSFRCEPDRVVEVGDAFVKLSQADVTYGDLAMDHDGTGIAEQRFAEDWQRIGPALLLH